MIKLTPIPGQGLLVNLDTCSELKVALGTSSFFEVPNQNVIRQGELGPILARAERFSDRNSVRFSLIEVEGGPELLAKSRCLPDSPRRKDVDAFESAVLSWLAVADLPSTTSMARQVIQSFRLPSPRLDPDMYRTHGPSCSRKLTVLWGCESKPGSSLPPLEAIAELRTFLRPSWQCWLKRLLLLLLLLLLLFLLSMIPGCPIKLPNSTDETVLAKTGKGGPPESKAENSNPGSGAGGAAPPGASQGGGGGGPGGGNPGGAGGGGGGGGNPGRGNPGGAGTEGAGGGQGVGSPGGAGAGGGGVPGGGGAGGDPKTADTDGSGTNGQGGTQPRPGGKPEKPGGKQGDSGENGSNGKSQTPGKGEAKPPKPLPLDVEKGQKLPATSTAKQDPPKKEQEKPAPPPGEIVLRHLPSADSSRVVITAELSGVPGGTLQIEQWTIDKKSQNTKTERLELQLPMGSYEIFVRGRSGDTVYTTTGTLTIGPPKIGFETVPGKGQPKSDPGKAHSKLPE